MAVLEGGVPAERARIDEFPDQIDRRTIVPMQLFPPVADFLLEEARLVSANVAAGDRQSASKLQLADSPDIITSCRPRTQSPKAWTGRDAARRSSCGGMSILPGGGRCARSLGNCLDDRASRRVYHLAVHVVFSTKFHRHTLRFWEARCGSIDSGPVDSGQHERTVWSNGSALRRVGRATRETLGQPIEDRGR